MNVCDDWNPLFTRVHKKMRVSLGQPHKASPWIPLALFPALLFGIGLKWWKTEPFVSPVVIERGPSPATYLQPFEEGDRETTLYRDQDLSNGRVPDGVLETARAHMKMYPNGGAEIIYDKSTGLRYLAEYHKGQVTVY